MELYIKHFSELTAAELYKIAQARIAVFVIEQNCPYQELDGKDLNAWHVWYEDEDGVAAYCRVLDKGVSYENEGSIGRVITVKRSTGLGYKVMMEGIRVAEEKYGQTSLRISAQQYAQGFYEKCGFVRVSDPYLEDDIPHVQMLRTGA
ncbi:MAG: GNAT family N-acetyltransferase [Oscillospiraceae bacterium]|nr:GNAT family N-acetyltransferase [Oscillospiraceae bacterium]